MSSRPLPKAQVKPMHVVHKNPLSGPAVAPEKEPVKEEKEIEWIKPRKKDFAERLTRNVAVAAALLLCAVAVRNAALPQSKDVFSAIADSVSMNLDESLGKLSFVSSLLPESALVFWNSSNDAVQVSAPVHGDVVHVFHEDEPYIALLGVTTDVRVAGDGEVMNVAHGDGEERVVRVRHDNGLETLYGNLQECFVLEGDQVYEGDIIGETAQKQPVFFEVRKDGRSIDPVPLMREVVATP